MQTRTYPLPPLLNPMFATDIEVDEIVAMNIEDDFALEWEPEDVRRTLRGIIIYAHDTESQTPVTIYLKA